MSYILSCCSTADLTKEHFEKRNIHYICFHYQLNGKDFLDDLGQTMPFDQFYQAMTDGAETRTSQVNAEEYLVYFEKFLAEGQDILHLTLSSGISGSINSANAAAEQLRAKYPERKIYIIDSLAASSGFGLLMDILADKRDAGMDIDELARWATDHRLQIHHWFFTTDLTYLIRGGRVSKVSGFVGSLLNICPLLNVDYMGRLIPRFKVRGKKKVISKMVEQIKAHAAGGTEYTGKVYISNSRCYEDAKAVADLIEEAFPKMDGKVQIYDIGTTIGSHTGPGTVALFFWGDPRVD